jgi:fructose-1,6-bisphosphatase II / sedoheptulose-1,7-bisphosphatase
VLDTPAKIERARGMGVLDPKRKYGLMDLASGDVVVALTGVTDGGLVSGVKFRGDIIETETMIYRSLTGTVRRIFGEHRELNKFAME